MQKRRFRGFNCHKTGHRPMPNIPEEPVLLNGFLHVGRICQACRVAYFEQTSSQKMEPSRLIAPDQLPPTLVRTR